VRCARARVVPAPGSTIGRASAHRFDRGDTTTANAMRLRPGEALSGQAHPARPILVWAVMVAGSAPGFASG
jgi:hypothetical protein